MFRLIDGVVASAQMWVLGSVGPPSQQALGWRADLTNSELAISLEIQTELRLCLRLAKLTKAWIFGRIRALWQSGRVS